MPAYEIPGLRFSGVSGAAIARRRFVTFNANEEVVEVTASTDEVVGASSQPNSAAGEVAEVYDGIVMVEAGAALTAGTPVMAAADARAIVYDSAVAGNIKAGVAVTNAAAAGELVSVKI